MGFLIKQATGIRKVPLSYHVFEAKGAFEIGEKPLKIHKFGRQQVLAWMRPCFRNAISKPYQFFSLRRPPNGRPCVAMGGMTERFDRFWY